MAGKVFFVAIPFPLFRYLDMQWTDRIQQVKGFLVIAAVLIAVASLVVSHFLVKDLAQEERGKMEMWAVAMRSLNSADENTDMNLVLQVINENRTIPVIVLDSRGVAQTFRNVEMEDDSYQAQLRQASLLGAKWASEGRSVTIWLDGDSPHQDYWKVCYDESTLLKRLTIYPLAQLGVVMLFVLVAIIALLAAKRAEQNKVWVGLSKETAHQLGTPISSLMAWVELLKEGTPDMSVLDEMEKDVEHLRLIANRFSKIGSEAELSPVNLQELLSHVADYMDRRTSRKIAIVTDLPRCPVVVSANASLFVWVVENLVKNSADAIGQAEGTVKIELRDDGRHALIEVSDTGKGIRKKDIPHVFRPGFTTKSRGWGLGLSLAKRIVESYHHGKIRVKSSEVGKGTTFHITLRKD